MEIAEGKYNTPQVINSFIVYNPNEVNEAFIKKYNDVIKWDIISKQMSLTEDFIDKFSKYIDFEQLSKYVYSQFSEDFIQKYADKLNWDYISANSKPSEKFIQKYANKVNWPSILVLQKGLSPEFKEKHKDKRKMYVNNIDFDTL